MQNPSIKADIKQKQNLYPVLSYSTRVFLALILALPVIWFSTIAAVRAFTCSADSSWCDPAGAPPGSNLPGPVWLQTSGSVEQVGSINIAGDITSGSGGFNSATYGVTSYSKAHSSAIGIFGSTPSATADSNLLGKENEVSAGIAGVGKSTGGTLNSWAGFFGDPTTSSKAGDGNVFAKKFCLPPSTSGSANLPADCIDSWAAQGGGDLWSVISGNDIKKKTKEGVVVIGADSAGNYPTGTKLAVAGLGNNGSRVYLNSSSGNPEIDLQLSNDIAKGVFDDHWGIYADVVSRDLKFWSKPSATDDPDVKGRNTFSLRADGVMVFGGYSVVQINLGVLFAGAGTGSIISSETTPQINYVKSDTGTSGTNSSIYIAGTTIKLTATPTGIYVLDNWSGVTCNEGQTSNTCTFIAPGQDTIVTAKIDIVLPSVTTLAAINIGATSATLRSLVDPRGNTGVGNYFRYGKDADYKVCNTTSMARQGSPSPISSTQEITATVPDLSPNTKYNYCPLSNVGSSYAYGTMMSFTTGSLSNYTVTVTKAGSGLAAGTVTSSPSGINCGSGSGCSFTKTEGTSITLTETTTSAAVFAGWSGVTCSEGQSSNTCTFTLLANTNITANFTTAYTITLNKTGAGAAAAVVTSNAGGINCGSTCTSSLITTGTSVILTENPNGGTFTAWSGVTCSEGQGSNTCTFNITSNPTITANFNAPANQYTVAVSKGGTGAAYGVVTGTGGINCGSTCSSSFITGGSSVTLTANPVGSTFAGWSGGTSNAASCNGSTNVTCSFVIGSNSTINANFTIVQYTLTTSTSGTNGGTGTITSSPAGINCGSTCSKAYDYGTSVILTATPASGASFSGWAGACASFGTTTTCTLNMTAARSTTATFTKAIGTG